MTKTEFQQTASSAGLIGLTAFLGALVGFVLQLTVAYYFGADKETDAYFMAQSTSELLTKLLMGGSIASVFIPVFIQKVTEKSKKDAFEIALNILHVISIVFLLLIVLLGIFTTQFVHFIAPGFDEKTTLLTVQLLRILLPSFFCLFLVDLGTSMLHALKKFTFPALLRIVAPTTSIFVILLFVRSIGVYSLAAGALAGSILQVSVIFWALTKEGFVYSFVFHPFDKTLKKLILLVYPFIFSMLVTQAAGLVYRVLVSDLPSGSLSSLKFAEKISQLMAIMFLASVTSVVYPVLSEKAAKKNVLGMRDTIGSAVRLIFFVTLPLVIGIALLRVPLVSFIFEHGSFSATDAVQTQSALLFFIIGLTTNGISALLGYTVLAMQKTKTSVMVTIISQLAAIALFFFLVPLMGHAGLALGSSLVPLVSAAFYFFYIRKTVPQLENIFIHKTYLKAIALGLAVFVAVTFLLPIVQLISAPRQISLFLQLVIPGMVGGLIFFGGAYAWGVPETQEVFALVTGKIKKWQGRKTL